MPRAMCQRSLVFVTVSPAGGRNSGRLARLAASSRWDGVLAFGLFAALELPAVGLGTSLGFTPISGKHQAGWIWVAVGAVMTLTLTARRRHPLRTWVVATVCAAYLLAAHTAFVPFIANADASAMLVFPAPLVALYTVARTGVVWRGYTLLGSGVALVLPLLNLHLPPSGFLGLNPSWDLRPRYTAQAAPLAAAVLVTVWFLGYAAYSRGNSAALEQARIAAEQAERAEHDRAVAAEERARIAAELHDITAHHISVVTLQAGAARMLAESGQPPDAELLSGIETASRQAMTEIRQALGVIRAGPDGAAPLPGLAQLPELTSRMALAGLTVLTYGPAEPLPGSADLTAYRIIQEGLANVARHSAAGTATVTFRREPGLMRITITDEGPSRGTPLGAPGGNGLIGLRERVGRYGGRLHAGPCPSGGFELRAEFPLPDTAGLAPLPARQHPEPLWRSAC
jgi:signal transduction histidine kinase